MGKKQDQIFNELLASIHAQQNTPAWQVPVNNAQNELDSQAMAGADYFKKGDFSSMPKGMFFNFDQPGQALDRYKKFANVNQGGNFALADQGGRGAATALQGKYLQDRFARDASANYQSNIANAADNVRGGLLQSSNAGFQNAGLDFQSYNAKNQLNSSSINALGGLMNSPYLNKPGFWSAVLPFLGKFGADALSAFGGGGGAGGAGGGGPAGPH